MYFCAHLDDGAIVFSNANFRGATPRNRKKFSEEIRKLMESGKVTGMSRRQQPKEDGYTHRVPWSFALITPNIKPEYDECRTDYEIGNLFLKYRGTDNIRSLTKLGIELIYKIQTGEINEFNCNLNDPGQHQSCAASTNP